MNRVPKLVSNDRLHRGIGALHPESSTWLAGAALFAAMFIGFAHVGTWSGAWPSAIAAFVCTCGLVFAPLPPDSTRDHNEVVGADDARSLSDTEASASAVFLVTAPVCSMPLDARLDLVLSNTGRVIHSYDRESAALGFIRDIVLFGSRQAAAQFSLHVVRARPEESTVVAGELLVHVALEDRAP